MTREEAINEWTFRSNHIKEWLDECGEKPSIRHYVELIDMTIEALSTEPNCKDCKKRNNTTFFMDDEEAFNMAIEALKGGDAEMNEVKSPYMRETPSEDGSDLISKMGEPISMEESLKDIEPWYEDSDLISRADAIEAVCSDCGGETSYPKCDQKQYCGEVQALLALPSAEAVQGWIPCSERLPSEKDGRVLVTKRDEVMTAIYSEFSGRWYLGDMCAVGGENPIAWMPLPEPYKERSE